MALVGISGAGERPPVVGGDDKGEVDDKAEAVVIVDCRGRIRLD